MTSTVALASCTDYNPSSIRNSIEKLLVSLGGIERFVKPGEKVLLKPNLLSAVPPERAVTTHPEIVKAVGRLVMDAGGKPFIADSPGAIGFLKVARESGMEKAASELGIPLFALSDSVTHKTGDERIFRILEISRHALEADRVINLPKLKTHTQMLMTLAVKNIFGCVVGRRKAQWHLKAGNDRYFFARMLVELYEAVSPCLNIMDGILGMEGDGPGSSGTPVECGILAASADGVAMDRTLLEIIGVDPEKVYTNVAAKEMGVGQTDLASIRIEGEPISSFKVKKFRLPEVSDLVPIPGFLRSILTNQLTTKPVEERKLCTLCDQCIDICPTEVISNDGGKLVFDYDNCIRCYCCLEVCPEGAIKPYKPFLARFVS